MFYWLDLLLQGELAERFTRRLTRSISATKTNLERVSKDFVSADLSKEIRVEAFEIAKETLGHDTRAEEVDGSFNELETAIQRAAKSDRQKSPSKKFSGASVSTGMVIKTIISFNFFFQRIEWAKQTFKK